MIVGPGIALAAAGITSLPTGLLAARFVRRESGADSPALPWIVTAANLSIGLWAALVIPADFVLIVSLCLGWALVALSAIDYLAFRLPDVVTLPLIGCGLIVGFWLPERDPPSHFIGAAVGFGLLYAIAAMYRSVRKREGLGLGDAKLAAAAGAWLGWQPLPAVLLISCAAAFIWIGIAAARRGGEALRAEIPFGVPLCLAFWLVWLYGTPNFLG